MDKNYVRLAIVAVVGGCMAYSLSLVAGDNASVADIIKNLVNAVFAGAALGGGGD